MTVEVRRATAADLARLGGFLDEAFVFGKGRSISLTQRFPGVFQAGNAHNLFFIEREGSIASALAVRPFDWLADGRLWRGAMVGAVATAAAHRRAGLASGLLEEAANALRADGTDFAVLWTAQPDFYRKLGWQGADPGVLGEIAGQASVAQTRPAVTGEQLSQVRQIRARWSSEGPQRGDADYGRLPLPAESVSVLLGGTDERQAYALVGRAGTTGILYEMIGYADAFEALWRDISTGFDKLLINDRDGSDSHQWLASHTAAAWQPKPLAMWLPLSSRIDFATMREWYVPYFDRI